MVSQPGEAGVAHVVADHVDWASAAGWQCTVACDPESRLAQLVLQRGGRLAPWHASRNPGPGLPAELRSLQQIIARTKPDLVHLHSSKAGLVGRLALRGRYPTVFQPHAWSFQAATGVQRALAARWERYAGAWTDATVCVSRAEEEQGAALGLEGPMVVLFNAVDSQQFRPLPDLAAKQALRSALGVPDRPLVVCLGRVCRQKGQDLLLAAWSRVVEAQPDAHLLVVGGGPDRDALMASSPAGVDFVGPVDNPAQWLQVADVVVVPSRWEGQALVVLEAMACGAAVVASDIEPNVETLPSAAGAVVSPEDPDLLAKALTERLGPGRARAEAEGEAGRRHVITHHHPAQAAGDLVSLYSTLQSRAQPSTVPPFADRQRRYGGD